MVSVNVKIDPLKVQVDVSDRVFSIIRAMARMVQDMKEKAIDSIDTIEAKLDTFMELIKKSELKTKDTIKTIPLVDKNE